jgi:hypothetical protein
MSDDKLRVLPRGTALVPHYGAQAAGMRKFHGWKHDATMGPTFIDPETKQTRHHGAFVKHIGVDKAIEIDMRDEHLGEYLRHLRDGDLWAADEFTARTAGVKWDKTFGGEHDAEPAPETLIPRQRPMTNVEES